MAHFKSREDKHLNVLSVILVYFVLLFCCHASCISVNVTRSKRDIFSYPGISGTDCAGFCQEKNSFYSKHTKSECMCECSFNYKTFVTAELKCVQDQDIRNLSPPLAFKLYDGETPVKYLRNITFKLTTTIEFKAPPYYTGKRDCKLTDIEELSHQNFLQWKSVKDYLLKDTYIFELDDEDIERHYTWLDADKHEGWKMLTLKWKDYPGKFSGSIMRINVTCLRRGKSETGLMFFKVAGTLRVFDNSTTSLTVSSSVSTTYYLTPTPSITTESTVPVYSTSSTVLSSISMTSLQLMTSLSPQQMTSSLLPSMTSPSLRPMMSSALQPMMSSSLRPMTSSSPRSLSETEVKQMTYSLNISLMVTPSSMAVVGPAKKSKSSSKAAVTGGVVAGIVVLLLAVVLLVYVLRKRRRAILRRKHSDLGHINPASVSSLTSLPTMNNPLHDGVYEDPEVVNDGTNRRSGVISIDSAMYDACLVVENPSARETKSVYDNIPESPENTYKALDPTKREPSAKYQSLFMNEHEYSTVADLISGAPIQEPLYSEVEVEPYMNDRRNVPTPPPRPAAVEPIYNELEGSDNHSKEGIKRPTPVENSSPLPPPLAPRKTPRSATAEPIYNELEDSDNFSNEDAECPKPVVNPGTPPSQPSRIPRVSTSNERMNGVESSDNRTNEGAKPEDNDNSRPRCQTPLDLPTPNSNQYEDESISDGDNGLKESIDDKNVNGIGNGLEKSIVDKNVNDIDNGLKESIDDKNVNGIGNGLEESIDDKNVNGIDNELEKSIDGGNEPVYSVLEEI